MAETVMNLPADRVYRLLVDYFKRERVKVKSSVEPSLIEVAGGSLLGSPHDVKMEMFPRNGRTLIEFHFDFAKTYVGAFLVLIVILAILGLLFGSRAIVGMIVMAAIIFAVGMPRSVDKSKKSFIDNVTDYLRNAEKAERKINAPNPDDERGKK